MGLVPSNISILACSVPVAMAAPTSVSVTPLTISIAFTQLSAANDIGRTPLTYYLVEWDQGTGTFIQIA